MVYAAACQRRARPGVTTYTLARDHVHKVEPKNKSYLALWTHVVFCQTPGAFVDNAFLEMHACSAGLFATSSNIESHVTPSLSVPPPSTLKYVCISITTMIHSGITSEPIDVPALLRSVKDPKAGAVVTFSGITRDSFEGKHVAALAYDAYVPMAEKTLARIAAEAARRFHLIHVALVHRIGLVRLSEESVLIAVSGAHRREAWDGAEWMLEEIKTCAEIWKKEEYTDGTTNWVAGQAVLQSRPSEIEHSV